MGQSAKLKPKMCIRLLCGSLKIRFPNGFVLSFRRWETVKMAMNASKVPIMEPGELDKLETI